MERPLSAAAVTAPEPTGFTHLKKLFLSKEVLMFKLLEHQHVTVCNVHETLIHLKLFKHFQESKGSDSVFFRAYSASVFY